MSIQLAFNVYDFQAAVSCPLNYEMTEFIKIFLYSELIEFCGIHARYPEIGSASQVIFLATAAFNI